jgi:hypothetical protein
LIVKALGRVPRQDFGERLADFDGFDHERKLAVLRVLSKRPSVNRVRQLFGSWNAAVAEAHRT